MKFRLNLSFIPLILYSFLMILVPRVNAQDTGWEISGFDSQITILEDTRVNVTETISVDFNTLQKHGIFRLIPVSYKTRYGNNLNVRFQLNSITDDAGQPIPIQQTMEGDSVKLKIGDPDKTITGSNTYVIFYTVNRVITTPTDTAELYWNITGNNWPVTIAQATATITGPSDSVTDSICFTGYLGSTLQDCQSNHNLTLATFSTTDLLPGQGLTAAVGLDPTSLTFPTTWQNLLWFLSDNWIYATPLVVFIFMFRLYWSRGRDKQYQNLFSETGSRTVPLFHKLDVLSVYGPPQDFSPGEAGVIVDEKVHDTDITAIIVDLARRGYFTIKDTTKKKFIFNKRDIELIRTDKQEKDLLPFETSIMDMLFGQSRQKSVLLNKLPSLAYQHLDKAKDNLYQHLTDSGYFLAHPLKVKQKYLVLAFGILFIGLFLIGPVSIVLPNPGGFIFSLITSFLIILGFAPFMPARTPKGRKALKEIVGLKEWVRLGAWREQIHEKHNFLEEVLPFTIAFGLTEKFLSAFKESDLKKLDWYQSDQPLTSAYFSSRINSINSNVTSGVASTRPKSSASSGGSGFSGGSSGGGFGGGGGGSW